MTPISPRPRRWLLANAALAAVFSTLSVEVNAQPSERPQPTSEPAPRSLRVWVDVGHSGLDKVRIRAAIERELDRSIELTDTADTELSVVVEEGRRVRVRYLTPSGEELTRTVDLPGPGDRNLEVIALLVGNLTRNEAADLIASLEANRASKTNETAPPPPPPARTTAPTPPKPPADARPPLLYQQPALNLSLFHPLSLHRDSERRVFNLELGLVYGRVGAIRGAALEFGALRVDRELRGLALGGFYSRVDGDSKGGEFSWIYSEGHAPLEGAQVSGLVSYRTAKVSGVNLAGAVQIGRDLDGLALGSLVSVSQRVNGVAISGAVTIARGPLVGASVAGLVGTQPSLTGFELTGVASVGGPLTGFALSGIANVRDDSEGLLVSSVANVTRDLDGASVSLVNVSRRVRGAQLGLVNVAKELDGAQVGLVNLAGNGQIQAESFVTNHVPLNVGLRFVAGYTYSELALGYQPGEKNTVFSAGVGAHFQTGPITFGAGVHGVTIERTDGSDNGTPLRTDLHYRARVGYRVTSTVEPFLGGGVRHGLDGIGQGDVDPEFFGGIALF